HIEQIVGDLKGAAERAAIARERLDLIRRSLAEYPARYAGKMYERAGLHPLQGADVLLAEPWLAAVEPSFRRKVEHLAPRHAPEAGGTCQARDEINAHGRIRMHFGTRHHVESKGKQPVAH